MTTTAILTLLLVAAIWLIGKLFDTFAKYWLQEFIVKPSTDKLVDSWKNWKSPSKVSDKQLFMTYYLLMALLFAGVTLHVSDTTNFGFLTKLTILLGTVATSVSVVFLGLVHANVKGR